MDNPLVWSTFYGHGVYPLGILNNLWQAIVVLPTLLLLRMALAREKRPLIRAAYVFFVLIHFPQPLYLFLEIKHLILQDGVADGGQPQAVAVFSALSALGLVLSVL